MDELRVVVVVVLVLEVVVVFVMGAGGSVNPSKKLNAFNESDDAKVGNWLKVVDVVVAVENDPADECPLLLLLAGVGEDPVDELDVLVVDETVLLPYGFILDEPLLDVSVERPTPPPFMLALMWTEYPLGIEFPLLFRPLPLVLIV